MRGRPSQVGDTRTSPNGYHYTRTPQGWELTHRIIAEQQLGRPLKDNERVRFKDGNRTNLAPENIVVRVAQEQSKGKKIARIKARIDELQAELRELERN